jgi:16S rRNA (uracil1498-N3)-methyltransferase
MHLFYTPDITGSTYTLNEDESKHCIRVLRLDRGDMVQLIDGRGGFYEAAISEANPKKCMVQIDKHIKEFGKHSFCPHIAIAPTKNIERFEWFLEKATEIGVEEITPLLCEHSERKTINAERLEKIMVSAMKQSLKAYMPKLNPLIGFTDFVSTQFNGQKFIAHCSEGHRAELKDRYVTQSGSLILIGPEGDFSPDEIILAANNGFAEVSMGKSRLRTETAGVVACHTINLMNLL